MTQLIRVKMSLPADESPPSLSPCYLDLDSVKSSPESIASLPEVATYPTDEPSSSRAGLTSTSESSLKSSTPKDRRPPQTCDVCGEKANSFHYDVASCNGCKLGLVTSRVAYRFRFRPIPKFSNRSRFRSGFLQKTPISDSSQKKNKH